LGAVVAPPDGARGAFARQNTLASLNAAVGMATLPPPIADTRPRQVRPACVYTFFFFFFGAKNKQTNNISQNTVTSYLPPPPSTADATLRGQGVRIATSMSLFV
jgi:hypothetical protein